MKQLTSRVSGKKKSRCFLAFAVLVLTNACAAIQPPGAGGPRASGPTYPVVLTQQVQRKDASILSLKRIAGTTGTADQLEVHLQPVTAAIKSLPQPLATALYLPKVGVNAEMNEEETRESLRRFISDWRVLIGANPSHLSLVERSDQPDGVKVARYEQRPFRYQLRGGYGILEIRFMPNRIVVDMTSTCIPDAERLQAALAAIVPKISLEDAIKHVRENGIVYTDSAGKQQTYNVPTTSEINVTELVTLVLPSNDRNDSLELHIAWEIGLSQAPLKTVYFDAVEGKIIAGPEVP